MSLTIKEIWTFDLMERMFASCGMGLVLVSSAGRFLDVNAVFCVKLGYTRDELLTMSVAELTHPEDHAMTSEMFKHFNDPSRVATFEKRYLHKNGTALWFKMRSEPAFTADDSPPNRIVMVEDITREKLDEINLAQLQVELRHSQRLETAGLLAGGVAHDFNNIITVIKGAGYLLAEELPVTATTSSHLSLIERAADRAARLTRQLLAFSRKQKISPVVLDPNEHLRESASLLTRTLGDDVRLQTQFASTWLVREDVTQFEQVLLNLAVNARHAMPKGGTLTIATRDVIVGEGHKFETSSRLRYTPAAMTPGSYVLLTVNDTGVGMERDILEQIFDPFFTTREKGEGAGLGLSVVYGIVTQIGGGISVLTQPGEGSEFQIYLPRTESRVERAIHAPAPPVQKNSGRILVLEDDENVRMLTSAVLRAAGYTVVEASNPRVLLNNGLDGEVDLILSDVMMPEMSGPEFSEIWLNRHPRAKFLFMSGFYDGATLDQKLTGKTLIQKPFRPSDLLLQVSRIITQG